MAPSAKILHSEWDIEYAGALINDKIWKEEVERRTSKAMEDENLLNKYYMRPIMSTFDGGNKREKLIFRFNYK